MHKNMSTSEDKARDKNEKDALNEEVVSSLIENFKGDLNVKDDSSSKSEHSTDSEQGEGNISFDTHHKSDHFQKEAERRTETDDKDPNDVDENVLRDRDVNLSEEEKKALMDESQIYKNDGNKHYQNGDYTISISLYTKALRTCPLQYSNERSIMYCNRAASEIKLELKQKAIADCSKAIELNPHYMKAYLRRSKLYEEVDNLDEALADYNKIIEFDPKNTDAIAACLRLPEQIKDKNEKLKEEMLGKLKDIGNTLLRPFGLSTNNFQMTKNPNSDGYSVNFVQNKN